MTRMRGNQAGLFRRWLASLRHALVAFTSGYRPERHYMRGGGTGGVA